MMGNMRLRSDSCTNANLTNAVSPPMTSARVPKTFSQSDTSTPRLRPRAAKIARKLAHNHPRVRQYSDSSRNSAPHDNAADMRFLDAVSRGGRGQRSRPRSERQHVDVESAAAGPSV